MNASVPTKLSDYQPPQYMVPQIELTFELDPESTLVTNRMEVLRQDFHKGPPPPLVLDSDQLELVSISVDDVLLGPQDYELTATTLTIHTLPDRCFIEIINRIHPAQNKELMGLYASSGNMCTQCEAQGFRRITFSQDRPDSLSVFTTKLIADKEHYPTLLSNGNLVEESLLDDGRHVAIWHDPFPKPTYLFALVAGRFDLLEGKFTTCSGRQIDLKIFTDPGHGAQCQHALEAVKRSMRWDELRYGREYDLDLFMIVAVNDFNFGAMENKGLNIFNAKFILASAQTATDHDYTSIASVVAHEYFHNWSGNRVTLRDWFQLSLKEGFTVYRDQSFDEDEISQVVHRINTVNALRAKQFKEDQGPMAHPVQPKSYLKIDNFYTGTIYGKGAEIIRMFNLILGDAAYRAACDEYFERFDGQAVTIEDFASTMQNHTEVDLTAFFRWYHQAGTPTVHLSGVYDAEAQTYTLHARQELPVIKDQPHPKPLLIPIKMGLIDAVSGEELSLPELYRGELFFLSELEQSITFKQIKQPVVPSLLRHFSAPVRLNYEYQQNELEHLMLFDTDGFNRWQAGQDLSLSQIDHLISLSHKGASHDELIDAINPPYLEMFGRILREPLEDRYFQAQLLTLPSETYVTGRQELVHPEAIVQALDVLKEVIATRYFNEFKSIFSTLTQEGNPQYNVTQMGRRALVSTCMRYLSQVGDPDLKSQVSTLASNYFNHSFGINMTDTMSALAALCHLGEERAEQALDRFHENFSSAPLVVNKWLSIQSTTKRPDALEAVKALIEHPSFSIENPNNVYATLLAFANFNTLAFHDPTGSGYTFIADQVLRLDRINPMVAARLVVPLTHWKRYPEPRRSLLKAELERLLEGHDSQSPLSDNVKEYVIKGLT